MIAETSKSIKLKGPVKWHTTLYPLQVFFVDPNARTKEWLVYENMVSQEMEQSVSSLITNKMPLFLNTMDSISLKLTKDLFYQHMISSYHGIGHTARVVYYSYLLASGIEGLTGMLHCGNYPRPWEDLRQGRINTWLQFDGTL